MPTQECNSPVVTPATLLYSTCYAVFSNMFPLGTMQLTVYDTCMDNHNHTPPSRDDPDQHGLGTYLRLCAPVSNGRRSEQLKEDTTIEPPHSLWGFIVLFFVFVSSSNFPSLSS
jgi:hypothetical protein